MPLLRTLPNEIKTEIVRLATREDTAIDCGGGPEAANSLPKLAQLTKNLDAYVHVFHASEKTKTIMLEHFWTGNQFLVGLGFERQLTTTAIARDETTKMLRSLAQTQESDYNWICRISIVQLGHIILEDALDYKSFELATPSVLTSSLHAQCNLCITILCLRRTEGTALHHNSKGRLVSLPCLCWHPAERIFTQNVTV